MKKKENVIENETTMEKVGILELISMVFIKNEPLQVTLKEAIADFPDRIASPEVKKELMDTVDRVDNDIMKVTTGGLSLKKTKSLNVSKEQNIQYLKDNPIKTEKNYTINDETEKIIQDEEREV
ncbi:MAG: hypothetical protein HFJ33_08075 [Clostridia bacterium]|uniref:hypothetical protein n=1 Tax=Thomasclavelia cocleata TaxID=69824 RepID=UPI00272EBF20|nr:hypothetical protein [Thomasclavelia cocleata]MCI8384787.1 hypothetical protein [Clostridia bacterium]